MFFSIWRQLIVDSMQANTKKVGYFFNGITFHFMESILISVSFVCMCVCHFFLFFIFFLWELIVQMTQNVIYANRRPKWNKLNEEKLNQQKKKKNIEKEVSHTWISTQVRKSNVRIFKWRFAIEIPSIRCYATKTG